MCTCLNNKHFGSWITNVFVLFSSTETWEKAPHWNERCGHENFSLSLMRQSRSAVTLICYHWISYSWTLLQANIRFCHYVSILYLYRNLMPGLCLHIYSASVHKVWSPFVWTKILYFSIWLFKTKFKCLHVWELFTGNFFWEYLTTEQSVLPQPWLKLQYS